MSAKQRLNAQLEKAAELRLAGDFDAASAVLEAVAQDHESDALGAMTVLGLPRRLHSAFLKLAKAERDPIKRIGYQYHLVPDPAVLAAYAGFTTAERRAITEANRAAIPPVIHQVWIGGFPVPLATKAWEQHAKAHGYGHFLWQEKDLMDAGVYDNKAFQAMMERKDYPGAVDIARYLVLEQEGGIYLDCDWYPARSDIAFHDLLPMAGLTAMAEEIPRKTGRGSLLLANSFIAAPAHHPVLTRLNAVLPEVIGTMPEAPAWWSTGPLVFTIVARSATLTLADVTLVAAELPRGAPFSDVEAACKTAETKDGGLLLAWKSW